MNVDIKHIKRNELPQAIGKQVKAYLLRQKGAAAAKNGGDQQAPQKRKRDEQEEKEEEESQKKAAKLDDAVEGQKQAQGSTPGTIETKPVAELDADGSPAREKTDQESSRKDAAAVKKDSGDAAAATPDVKLPANFETQEGLTFGRLCPNEEPDARAEEAKSGEEQQAEPPGDVQPESSLYEVRHRCRLIRFNACVRWTYMRPVDRHVIIVREISAVGGP